MRSPRGSGRWCIATLMCRNRATRCGRSRAHASATCSTFHRRARLGRKPVSGPVSAPARGSLIVDVRVRLRAQYPTTAAGSAGRRVIRAGSMSSARRPLGDAITTPHSHSCRSEKPPWVASSSLAYKPKPGCEPALLSAVSRHLRVLMAEGLVTARPPLVMRSADGTIIEAFEWGVAGRDRSRALQCRGRGVVGGIRGRVRIRAACHPAGSAQPVRGIRTGRIEPVTLPGGRGSFGQTAAFDACYFSTHVPLARQNPGPRSLRSGSGPPHVSQESDMFDHVKIGVSDYAASKAFFLKALAPLGVVGGGGRAAHLRHRALCRRQGFVLPVPDRREARRVFTWRFPPGVARRWDAFQSRSAGGRRPGQRCAGVCARTITRTTMQHS